MDLEAMLRHATEFNFQVTAFHHVCSLIRIIINSVQALDAWRVPEMIKRGSNVNKRYVFQF